MYGNVVKIALRAGRRAGDPDDSLLDIGCTLLVPDVGFDAEKAQMLQTTSTSSHIVRKISLKLVVYNATMIQTAPIIHEVYCNSLNERASSCSRWLFLLMSIGQFIADDK